MKTCITGLIWAGTGLIWTVNKQGGKYRKSPETIHNLKVLFKIDNVFSSQYDKNETEPVWLSPVFANF